MHNSQLCRSSLQKHVLNVRKDARTIYKIDDMTAMSLFVTEPTTLYWSMTISDYLEHIFICCGYNSSLPITQSST